MPPASEIEKLMAELGAVWRLAVHLCEVRHAEVLVQETFQRAFRHPNFPRRDPRPTARLELFRILYEVAREHAAKSALEKAAHTKQAQDTPSVVDISEQNSRIDPDLQKAVCDLPVLERAVFLLSVVERLRYSDIAEIVDAPAKDVRRLLTDARRHVAVQLNPPSDADDAATRENETKPDDTGSDA